MNERIHECLDGERSPVELTAEERLELEELETVVEESLVVLRRAPVPDVAPAVMERIHAAPAEESPARGAEAGAAGVLEGILRWLWTPRPVRLRPAWALAGLAILVLATSVLPVRTDLPAGPEAVVGSGEANGPVLYVRFELEAPEASSVTLAGSFSQWEPRHELAQTAPGRWSALVPLEPGVHEYAFVVDGERWIADPDAPRVADGFGGVNSQIALVPPAERRNGQS